MNGTLAYSSSKLQNIPINQHFYRKFLINHNFDNEF